MTLSITIVFYFALLGLAGLFGYKYWQMKRGIVSVSEGVEHPFHSRISFRLLRKIAVYWTKIGLQHVALFLVKYGLITTNWVKRNFYKQFPNAKHWFSLSHGDAENGSASFFLHNVSEYKMRIQKIKRKLKSKDAQIEK